MAKETNKKAKRQIIKAKIDFISLCPAGANNVQTIYKSKDSKNEVTILTASKAMTEKGELFCVVYAPDMVDSQGDTASAEVIKDFAYDFAKRGGAIDIRHNEEAVDKEDIFIAESMIIQKDDPRFTGVKDYAGNVVDVTGGWGVVLKVEDEELRNLYRSGEWGGISMGGLMVAKDVDTETSITKMFKEFIDKFKSSNKDTENITMGLSKEDKQEIAEIATNAVTDILKKQKEEAEKAAKEAAEKAAKSKTKLGLGLTEPVLKANPTEEDILKHRKCLEIFELSKSVDSSNSKEVFEYQQKAKQIATAKEEDLDKIVQKQSGSAYDTYFQSNQSGGEPAKTTKSDDDALIAAVNKELDATDEK